MRFSVFLDASLASYVSGGSENIGRPHKRIEDFINEAWKPDVAKNIKFLSLNHQVIEVITLPRLQAAMNKDYENAKESLRKVDCTSYMEHRHAFEMKREGLKELEKDRWIPWRRDRKRSIITSQLQLASIFRKDADCMEQMYQQTLDCDDNDIDPELYRQQAVNFLAQVLVAEAEAAKVAFDNQDVVMQMF